MGILDLEYDFGKRLGKRTMLDRDQRGVGPGKLDDDVGAKGFLMCAAGIEQCGPRCVGGAEDGEVGLDAVALVGGGCS